MDKLIEALNIFLKYQNHQFPTHCEHDILLVVGISRDSISKEDCQKLDELGFFWSDEYESWASYRFGSA
jgi:hypothetical protein